MISGTNLVFLISQPRSGSTLVQSIISNNPSVETASEPWLLLPFLGYFQSGVHGAVYNYEWMRFGLNDFITKKIGDQRFKQHLCDFLISVYTILATKESSYILDKTPRYYEIAPLIREFFPGAKFIVLKRNPFAVFNSIIRTWKVYSIDQLYNYKNDLLKAPFAIQKFLDTCSGDPNVLEVQYETLMADPIKGFKNIYDWLGIPFHEGVLDYSKNDKFRGQYGDQVGIKKNARPVSDKGDSWKGLLENKFWSGLLRGYSAFLGAQFLDTYGDYRSLDSSRTEEFTYFQFVCARKESRTLGIATEAKALARSCYYRAKFGAVTRSWRMDN